MITHIQKSPRKNKRLMAVVITKNGTERIHFGYDGAMTYVDGVSKETRDNYRKRHYGNYKEQVLIDNLIPSPSLLAFHILWGDTRSIEKNIEHLNNLWREKYHKRGNKN